MRMPSYLDEFDSYDSSYNPKGYSMYTGDSRMNSQARSSRLRDIVRHTEYHSNAERDFTKPYRPAAFAEKSKLIASIATTPFPVNAKIPTSVGKYNGMTDPSDHLQNFIAVGGVSGWTLPYWCHMFALTLIGAAREWFEKLPDGEVSSWDDLVKKFSQHFSQQKKHTRDQSEILDVVRRDNESIEDFITRFNDESLNISRICKDMLRGAFRKNVKCDDLFRTITGRDGMPKEWDDLMIAAKVYANTEKTLRNGHSKQKFMVEFQNPRPNKQAKGPIWSRLQANAEASKPFDARSLIGNKNKTGPSNRGPSNWTPLSKTPAEILTTENIKFRKPQSLTRRSFLDAAKHCSYYDDIGQNKNECRSLKNEIEMAVKSGKLGHLAKNGKPENGKAPMRDVQGPSKKQIKDLNVHMIQNRRITEKKRKEFGDEEWKNKPVTFPRIKGGPINKNPLIITALFGHYRSQYVFFDTGSTSDIMYEQCFEQLEEDDQERLRPIHAPVYRFGREIMHPRGVITFPVTLSDGVHSRTEEVEFLVLPATSKHDIILGREAIGDFNAHPSTAHGAVGVPTRTGIEIIHVNRHCFTTEISRPNKVSKQNQRTESEKWVLNKKFPDQTIVIGPVISEIVRTFLKQLLTKNIDIFAWQPADITGVP
ncbi:uncharacterized protein LOC143561144 [Bidens hawaiensis]|uniref:uncharacterized protein LOC143561144 n=1 Tax=Bidens hawaiensis TaxID=980011 RepID=UPI00404A75D4